jgi:quercetin dioxygenase-like cupin family protein
MSIEEGTSVSAKPISHEIESDLVTVAYSTVVGREAYPGLVRRVLAFNDKLMIVEHTMREGSVFPLHSHPEEQLAYLVSGHIRVEVGDTESFEAVAGDSFVVRGNVEHQVIALEHSVALDVFTPYRPDFLEWVARTDG